MNLKRDDAVAGPHAQGRVHTTGTLVQQARVAVLLMHGRGGAAEDMLSLAATFRSPGIAFVAPQAHHHTWYPQRFLAPLEDNEPHLSSALALVGALVRQLDREGIPPEQQVLLGFSQGGCLALEFAGRNGRRYGGVVGLSAGLIGPPGRSWNFNAALDGTPVFLGCSDRDPHIPRDRLEESARELARIGGQVELKIYPGLGHTINQDELERVQQMLDVLPHKRA